MNRNARSTKAAQDKRKPTQSIDRRKRPAPLGGTAVTWPAGFRTMLGVSAVTLWRWEREGLVPKRDVFIGGRSGWRPETIAAALAPRAQ